MGVGCCALVSLFERDVCLAGTAAVVDMLVGEEETQGSGCRAWRLPASLCAHLAVARGAAANVPHHTQKAAQLCWEPQPHLPGLGLCQVHTRWTRARIPHYYHCQRQPKTYHRHQAVLKTSEARSHGRYNIHRKAILTLSLQCPETAQARPCAGPLPSG